ncbi:MAG TPA: flagellar basal body P-ring formation chaperone FlgA [Opitutaceae bacterium]|jgi:flagella basal body P-ring formation protein FlgA|nr:flagellar basal body P-ring formation chaperone FlgA [Opitutaceae bacterium]
MRSLRLLFALATLLASGAALCAEPPPAAPFTSAQLASALQRDLAGHFRLDGDFRIELVRAWDPPAKTAAAWDVVVTEYPSIPASTMLVRCSVLADGQPAADVSLLVRATLWRDAWYARQPVAANATFDAGALEARRTDFLREHDALPAAVGDRSYIFARQVQTDRLLTWHDLARRPLVRKGEVVDVVAAEGGLLVTMKAMAVENGTQGDLITVRNLETAKNITGLVVDEDRVQVRF